MCFRASNEGWIAALNCSNVIPTNDLVGASFVHAPTTSSIFPAFYTIIGPSLQCPHPESVFITAYPSGVVSCGNERGNDFLRQFAILTLPQARAAH